MLGLQNEREWLVFCQHVLIRPELASDERFATNLKRSTERRALHSIIVETFAALNAEQVIARLEVAQIANARVNDMHDVWDHAQLRARGRWSQVGTPAGVIPALLPPGTPDCFSSRMDSVPALGQHTDSILAELGWRPADVERLRIGGAI
jgi:itaconate CoA-transferase